MVLCPHIEWRSKCTGHSRRLSSRGIPYLNHITGVRLENPPPCLTEIKQPHALNHITTETCKNVAACTTRGHSSQSSLKRWQGSLSPAQTQLESTSHTGQQSGIAVASSVTDDSRRPLTARDHCGSNGDSMHAVKVQRPLPHPQQTWLPYPCSVSPRPVAGAGLPHCCPACRQSCASQPPTKASSTRPCHASDSTPSSSQHPAKT